MSWTDELKALKRQERTERILLWVVAILGLALINLVFLWATPDKEHLKEACASCPSALHLECGVDQWSDDTIERVCGDNRQLSIKH